MCALPVDQKEATILCAQCGGRIRADTQLCPHCHAPIIRRYCTGCDRLVPDQTAFCPYCHTSATAKKSVFKRFGKQGAIAIACAILVIAFIISMPLFHSAPSAHNHASKKVTKPETPMATFQTPPISPSPSGITKAPMPAREAAMPETHSASTVLEEAPALESQAEAEPVDLLTEGMRMRDGRRLTDIGSRLLQQRRYAQAVSVLTGAVEAFPPGTRDLSYGLALFKLGSALRLNGQAEQAAEILRRAMEFGLIRSQAQREIQLATREIDRLSTNR